MAYSRTTWVEAETPLSAANMNNIEDGVQEALSGVQGIISTTIKEMILAAHPVGSIYMSTSNTNPGTFLGGTWVAWGSGRVPVGVNTSDSDFNTVEKAGGRKDAVIPLHNHTFTGTAMANHSHPHPHTHTYEKPENYTGLVSSAGFVPSSSGSYKAPTLDHYHHISTISTNTGGVSAASTSGASAGTPSGTISNTGVTAAVSANANLQPYITCYMWKRTA